MEKNGGAAPTGCYKCGRPGHWSRDCPLSASNANSNSNPNPNPNSNTNLSQPSFKSSGALKPLENVSEKPKKPPRTRPKLTPELLLSNDGLGYVLRHFPRAFKFRGRGHEVSDLGNLIGLYTQWHSHLLPYYSFDQFVGKVEQVGATKRVRTCLRELRERVADGGDPSKLHEPPVEHDDSNCKPAEEDSMNLESTNLQMGEPPTKNLDAHDIQEELFSEKNLDADDIQEELFAEIYRNTTEEPCQSPQSQIVTSGVLLDHSSVKELSNQVPGTSREIHISEEQRARMEANRLKALERAAARAQSLQAA